MLPNWIHLHFPCRALYTLLGFGFYAPLGGFFMVTCAHRRSLFKAELSGRATAAPRDERANDRL